MSEVAPRPDAVEPSLRTEAAHESPLACVPATRNILDSFGLSTKYSLGQNFLVNDDVIHKIILLADVSSDDTILEVGPGIGTLTYALLSHAKQVIAVERDTDLPQVLASTLKPFNDRFCLLEQDALSVTKEDLAAFGENNYNLPNKMVSNLPYEVAATITLDYFQHFDFLQSATVMVQREVADRMAAQPATKQYGAYTVKLALYAKPSGRFNVGPGNFYPPPRVESTVQRLNRRVLTDADGVQIPQETLAAACVMADAAFATRRKTIANSCKTYFAARPNSDKAIQALPDIFERAGVSPSVRGEVLPPDVYVELGEAYRSVLGA